MKKVLSLILLLAVIITALAACAPDEESGGADYIKNGKELAQLLLASERLDLKDPGNIFAQGREDLESLLSIADENLGITYGSEGITAVPLSGGERINEPDGSWAELDGTTFKWGNFAEYSNSYSYFEELTDSIKTITQVGIDMIDYVKKNVRVIDKWVDDGYSRYYLHVEENSETLLTLREDGNQIELCRRHKNAAGENVYEIYTLTRYSDGDISSRMLYIPGRRYEYSNNAVDSRKTSAFVADNGKGYWEVFSYHIYDEHPSDATVSCMVVKDDICYDAFYNPSRDDLGPIKFISADKKTDLVYSYAHNPSGGTPISLYLQGFTGYDRVEFVTTEDKIAYSYPCDNDKDILVSKRNDGEDVYQMLDGWADGLSVYFNNGVKLSVGDEVLDGRVRINYILASHQHKLSSSGYTGQIDLSIEGETYADMLANLHDFYELTGLECRRDTGYIESGMQRAWEELEYFVPYYEWNGERISDHEALGRAYYVEIAKWDSYYAEYERVKNAEVISRDDQAAMAENAYFAGVDVTSEDVSYAYGRVEIDSIEITPKDKLLFVEGEPYTVGFALLGKGADNGGIVHLTPDAITTSSIAYNPDADLKVRASDVRISLPRQLAYGQYSLVVYITTEDGIRSSGYAEIKVDSAAADTLVEGITSLRVTKGEGGELLLTYSRNETVSLSLESASKLDYTELYELIAAAAYKSGVVIKSDAKLETHNAKENYWYALDEDGTYGGGMYRLTYENKNGDNVVSGFVIASVAIPE